MPGLSFYLTRNIEKFCEAEGAANLARHGLPSETSIQPILELYAVLLRQRLCGRMLLLSFAPSC